jgi:RNA recognition motif-containing protein
MSMKLYVGNLSYEMTEPQLQTLFSEAGEVTSAKIISDRQTGQARGFCGDGNQAGRPEGHFHPQRPGF